MTKNEFVEIAAKMGKEVDLVHEEWQKIDRVYMNTKFSKELTVYAYVNHPADFDGLADAIALYIELSSRWSTRLSVLAAAIDDKKRMEKIVIESAESDRSFLDRGWSVYAN